MPRTPGRWRLRGGRVCVCTDTVYARDPLTPVKSERGPEIGSDQCPIVTTWRWTD